MQIVIDIQEDDYYDILQYAELKVNTEFENLMITAIKNGAPLPKGHGRMIDADELYNSLEFPTQQFASAFKQVLDDAPTIIDKEG